MKYIYFTILFAIISITLNAQMSTLWHTKGKKIEIQEYTLIEDEYEEPIIRYKNKKGKNRKYDASEVFSITSADGSEDIFYKKDTLFGDIYEVEDMRIYLNGKTDAKAKYKGNAAFFGGIAAGIAGGMVPAVVSNDASVPLGTLVPITYTMIVGNTSKSIDKIKAQNPGIDTNEYYLTGYQKGIQENRMKKSIWGMTIGISAGFIAYFAFID